MRQQSATLVWPSTPLAGGANNVALVGSQFGGNLVTGSGITISFAMPGNVTSGNSVLVGVNIFLSGAAWNFTSADVTKSAGTATIGTVVLDVSQGSSSNTPGAAIFRVPITGNGSLTLLYTISGGTGNNNLQIGCAEFTGLNAAPLDAGGTGTNSGTGTSHTTGSLTSSVPGLIYYSASEDASASFTRTISNVTVRNDQTGATQYTGLVQYKIINTSPNTLTDVTGSNSAIWRVVYATYKTS